MRNDPNNFDMAEAQRLANSPAGQQLLTLLSQQGGNELNAAVASAASGDYAQAKKALSALLQSPEAQALLRQLEE